MVSEFKRPISDDGPFFFILSRQGLKGHSASPIPSSMQNSHSSTYGLLALLIAVLTLVGCVPSQPKGPLILAASSLQQPLEMLGEQWVEAGYDPPQFSFASSAALARQIENGSAGDIFISADRQWTDYLTKVGRIDPERIYTIAGNTLVVAAPIDSDLSSLNNLGTFDRIVTGDTDTVPLGRYAKEALTAADKWEEVSPKLVSAPSARAALVKLARDEVDAGILYASDAQGVETIKSLPFPAEYHAAINYAALRLPASSHPDAQAFLEFIASPAAAQAFDNYGFTRP